MKYFLTFVDKSKGYSSVDFDVLATTKGSLEILEDVMVEDLVILLLSITNNGRSTSSFLHGCDMTPSLRM